MQHLSGAGRRALDELAARYGFGAEAAETLARALAAGGGAQAQFSHPELGGMGQWSAGGMIMIGDMFNNGLKQRVDGFLSELSGLLAAGSLFEPPPARRDGREGEGLFAPGSSFASADWPQELGRPASSGAQNDLHYAYFPDSRRLAIRKGGHITVYDTADHAIGGVSQQQSGDQSLTFTSQRGTVRLDDLRRVGDAPGDAPAPPPAAAEPSPPSREPSSASPAALSPASSGAASAESDVIATIERLAGLRDRGILSDAEFAAKKAELLARL